jgi:hypothetical protein
LNSDPSNGSEAGRVISTTEFRRLSSHKSSRQWGRGCCRRGYPMQTIWYGGVPRQDRKLPKSPPFQLGPHRRGAIRSFDAASGPGAWLAPPRDARSASPWRRSPPAGADPGSAAPRLRHRGWSGKYFPKLPQSARSWYVSVHTSNSRQRREICPYSI